MEKGVVHIVHHIDTEGPLYESLEVLFERLDLVFGIKLTPSIDNLNSLRNNKFPIKEEIHEELKKFIDPSLMKYNENWHQLEEMIKKINDKKFRNKFLDSYGNGWIYNWHIMDHVGFNNDNPRRRSYGHHTIYNFYEKLINNQKPKIDSLHWHFHPISFSKSAHIPATSYDNSMNILHEIITRRLIDKKNFPVVNRAGFHTVRFDSNLFLEQWMPFDASNQSVKNIPKFQTDMINGRYGDWRGAPGDWSIYNPAFNDWRKKGNLKRSISRVLNINSRHREVSESDIKLSFEKAKQGENVYLGITNHDWRDMYSELTNFRDKFDSIANKYSNVNFKHSESINAFRSCLKLEREDILKNKIDFKIKIVGNILKVDLLNGDFFGPQPYLAIKTIDNKYFHDNFDFGETNKQFTYVFDEYTININRLEEICVASNDIYGNTCIKSLKF